MKIEKLDIKKYKITIEEDEHTLLCINSAIENMIKSIESGGIAFSEAFPVEDLKLICKTITSDLPVHLKS